LNRLLLTFLVIFTGSIRLPGVELQRYYAYQAVEDRNGVIAPWYGGQNGQCDYRVRIAAETIKRYPWAESPKVDLPAPEFVYNGTWKISAEGTIAVPQVNDWTNGDLGQRAAYVLSALVDYYRYSSDPAAIAAISLQADTMLQHAQTGPDDPWPRFLISVPNKGRAYGQADPHGMIQLDIVAEVGLGLVRAYEVTGRKPWLDAAAHWAEVLAAHCDPKPNRSPWNRYANPEDVPWDDEQTGGVVFLLTFFDELIRVGRSSPALIDARKAALAYFRDVLLPRWTVNDTWGRNYWDWADAVQAENVTEFAARYLIEHPADFPNWRADARNILSLFLNHTSVAATSNGDVYSGAWAYPESSGCCTRSLWYGPLEVAPVFAQYGVMAQSEWGREMARRQVILATYDAHETGVVEDNIDGGQIVAGGWFKIAHPMALKHVLGAIAWMPDIFGAPGENHLVRTSAVIDSVVYEKGKITYHTFDAPNPCVDVLRLAFPTKSVTADGHLLGMRADLAATGWRQKDLGGGDWLLFVRHDGSRRVSVEGDDPQQVASGQQLGFSGNWRTAQTPQTSGMAASAAGAAMRFSFVGNQVRVVGEAGPEGGLADVSVDGVKQLAGIDCWNPSSRGRQVLYYRNGLSNQAHTIEVTARGAGNPVSRGHSICVDAVQWSAANRPARFGEGGGPTQAQRFIFGYAGRHDWIDSSGQSWRPGTEFIARLGHGADSVASSWWTDARRRTIVNTTDPELYRHGVHAHDFTVYVTVGPGSYHARLKFAETRNVVPAKRPVSIEINGEAKVTAMDIAATAGGLNRAVDLVFDDIQPNHGVVALHLSGGTDSEAILQALEVGPGPGGSGAKCICLGTK
jgi:hypothetical protein